MGSRPVDLDTKFAQTSLDRDSLDDVADEDVFGERLQSFARQGRCALILHPVIAAALALVIWHGRPVVPLSLWVGAIAFISLLRIVHFNAFLKAGKAANLRWTARLFVIGAVVSGGLWGVSAVLFMPEVGSLHREMLFLFLIGLSAGSALLASSYVPVAIAFNSAILLPLAFAFFIEDHPHHLMMALMILFFVGILVQFARASERTIKNAIDRRRENEQLVGSLRTAVAEAEAARKSQADFLANISHEIRTPMNGVLGMISMAMDERDDSRRRNYLRTAERSANSLLRIINDLLDLSHIEAGKFRIRNEVFELEPLVDEAVELVRPESQKKGLTLSTTCENSTGRALVCDPERLRQVLLNLLGNAIKFTDEGEIALMATVDEGASGHRLRVAVRDTGRGISEELYPRLFGRFQQGDSSYARRQQGSGLGLAICREIIEAMGGRIGVESQEGQGSRFWFEVPVELEPAHHNPANTGSRPAAEGGLRILVAEDNEINQQVVTAFLEHYGHSYEVVSSGEAVLAALDKAWRENRMFDVILMDVRMPGLDGIETTRRIRSRDDACATIPVVALTAHALAQHKDEYLAAGMCGYIAKPIQPAMMESEIRRAVETRADNEDDVPGLDPQDEPRVSTG